ncbi:MAG: LysM peptidoglycan-binding domain-containing protein [Akkermansiaceae bacterium]
MKKTIQTKRSQSKASGFRALYAKTKGSQRKMNAATATADAHTDMESDIPNVGIGRALLVILLLHVVAIGAIYVHMTFFGDRSSSEVVKAPAAAVSSEAKKEVAPVPVEKAKVEKKVMQAAATSPVGQLSERYIVTTGDSYSRIAQVRNVDEVSLRALNNDKPLRAGVVLDLPAELSSRPVDVSKAAQSSEGLAINKVAPPEVSVAVMVKPKKVYPQAIEVEETVSNARDSGQRYTVQSGDTLWRISNRYKVSREELLSLNGIQDANKLQVGFELKIPAQ